MNEECRAAIAAAVAAERARLRALMQEPDKPYYPDPALNDAYLRGMARCRLALLAPEPAAQEAAS